VLVYSKINQIKIKKNMTKVITYTLDKGTGEQHLIDLDMKNISSEIEAMASDYFKTADNEDDFIVTIRVQKNATKDELDKLADL